MDFSKLQALALSPEMIELADKYIPYVTKHTQISYREYFETILYNIASSEFLVPVLGVQGVGKSSFLNALLIDDVVLPIDAEDTTCIPVEIRYGCDNDSEAIVFYADEQTPPKKLQSLSSLEHYVHNKYNSGNTKNVSHIVVFKRDELLASGMVLVDLPGVGSLNLHNVETTIKYIERLSAAIFLLRTVPPITRSERVFITYAWPKLTIAWFIQNQWNDESPSEVEDGKQVNQKVLNEIADQYKTEAPRNIRVINVFKVLADRLKQDREGYRLSDIEEFRKELSEVAVNWKTILKNNFVLHLSEMVERIEKRIELRFKELRISKADLQTEYTGQERICEAIFERNNKNIASLNEQIATYRGEMIDYAETVSKKQSENLRSEMRRIISSGVVDGELLNRAFVDNYNCILKEVMEDLSLKLFEIQKNAEVAIGKLEIRTPEDEFKHTGSFQREVKLKFEKAFPPIFNLAGLWAGARAGGAIGARLGPYGVIVGAFVGIVLSNWLGSKTKQGVNKKRQSLSIRDLEEPIRLFKDDLRQGVDHCCNSIFEHIEQALREFKMTQTKQMEDKKHRHEMIYNQSADELENKRIQLREDERILKNIKEQILCL